MVDGDAIVEKLNRSDGNSRPYTWPLATYVYAYVNIWHIHEAAYIFLHTHWKIRCTARSDEYRVSVLKISIFSLSSYRNASYFYILWFLSKYLHIISDENSDEVVCLPQWKWGKNIDISAADSETVDVQNSMVLQSKICQIYYYGLRSKHACLIRERFDPRRPSVL